jgi:deazaflavin-dependent oxidoreductase (nitroreductase family)
MSTERFLYLVTRGRKTGQPREIEIWYVEEGNRFYIVAERREQAHWVKNVRVLGDVAFSVGSRADRASHVPRTAARARVVDDAAEAELAARIRALMQQKYGWSEGLMVEIAPVG